MYTAEFVPDTIEDAIAKYSAMLANFVSIFDAINERGMDFVRDEMGVNPQGTQDETLLILIAYQTALVNVLNDLENIESKMRKDSNV